MSEPTHAFVATLPCGHAIEMVVDDPSVDDLLVQLYEDNVGREIRRLPVDEVRAIPMYVRDCTTCRNPPPTRTGSY